MKLTGQSREQEKRGKSLATKIVASILDKGLAASTWRDNNSAAYEELLRYRTNMVASVNRVLRRSQKKEGE